MGALARAKKVLHEPTAESFRLPDRTPLNGFTKAVTRNNTTGLTAATNPEKFPGVAACSERKRGVHPTAYKVSHPNT